MQRLRGLGDGQPVLHPNYIGITTAIQRTLGPVPRSSGGWKRGGCRGSNLEWGSAVDADISSHVSNGTSLRTAEGAGILAAITNAGLHLKATQVRFESDKHKMTAVVDGIATDKHGRKIVLEFKTGYARRLARQQKLDLPSLGDVWDNKRSRSLLQLGLGMHLAQASRGLLLIADRRGAVTTLRLPTAFASFFKAGVPEAVLSALAVPASTT